MRKKLTLRLDKKLIDYAKTYAEERDTSVSQLVADYFAALAHANEEKAQANPQEEDLQAFKESLPPITRSLVGIAAGSEASEEDYYRYLEEKHR